jgi:pimeloyl-ACP methyl ester carboxylesterase
MLVPTRHGPVAVHVSGQGPALLLLHANPGDHRDWDAVAPALARDHQVLAVDWPGYGDSPPPSPPASASALACAEIAIDVADHLDLRAAPIAGNSVGGFAAVRLAVDRPARVGALILVDSGGFTAPGWVTRAACWIKGREWVTRLVAGAFARRYLHRRGAHVAAILDRAERGRHDPATVAVDAAIWRSFADRRHDLRALRLAVPALVVWGRRDPVLRADRDALAAGITAGVAPVVLDTGHMPFAEDPDGFLAQVLPFLAGLASRPAA